MKTKIILMIMKTTVASQTVTIKEILTFPGVLPVTLGIAWLIDKTHIFLS